MKKMKLPPGYKVFDASEHLTDEAMITGYLTAAAEDSNPDVFILALGDVAKARGMAKSPRLRGWGGKACTRRSRPARIRALRPSPPSATRWA